MASVGLAPNKFLAKVASDVDKPNGFVVVAPGEERTFLDPLPVTRVWGVGKRTAEVLERLGVRTIGDLHRQSDELLDEMFGQYGTRLRQLSMGIDDRPVVAEHEAKSISHETTFGADVDDASTMRVWLLDLAEQVGARARRLRLKGRTVFIKVRFNDFKTLTRSMTLDHQTHVSREIRDSVDELFSNRLGVNLRPVSCWGWGLSGFDERESPQADLFGQPQQDDEVKLDSCSTRSGPSSAPALRRGRPETRSAKEQRRVTSPNAAGHKHLCARRLWVSASGIRKMGWSVAPIHELTADCLKLCAVAFAWPLMRACGFNRRGLGSEVLRWCPATR